MKYILAAVLVKSGAARVSNPTLPYVKAGFAAPDILITFIVSDSKFLLYERFYLSNRIVQEGAYLYRRDFIHHS